VIVICGWCKELLGEKEPFEDVSITHGICPDCMAEELVKDQPGQEDKEGR